MDVQPCSIPGLMLIKPRVFTDDRGYFFEAFNARDFSKAIGKEIVFVQDNISQSRRGVLRGLHFQRPPHAQDKLVRVTRGSVLDVAVDLRAGSPTFGTWEAVELSEENHHALFIPKGFAHGFIATSDLVTFEYKVSDGWDQESEGGIVWSDPDLSIAWGIEQPIVSKKDAVLPRLSDLGEIFRYES